MDTLSLNDMTTAFARRSGFVYKRFVVHEASRVGGEVGVARGRVDVFTPRPGLTLALTELESCASVSGEAVYPAGLTMAVALDGTPCPINHGGQLTLAPGPSATLCSDASVVHAGQAHSGFRGRVALLHAAQEWLQEARLADHCPESASRFLTNTVSPALQQGLGDLYAHFQPRIPTGSLCGKLGPGPDRRGLDRMYRRDPMRIDASRDLDAVWEVRRIMERDPLGDHTLTSLARAVAVSSSSLKAKFPMVFGTTVVAFLRDLRLDIARSALQHGRWSIAEAAYAVGYNYPSNFSTAFKRKFGHSPQQTASGKMACGITR